MKKILLIFVFLTISLFAISQTFKFGSIPDDQWEIHNCSFDSTSNSLVLFDKGVTTISIKDNVRNFDPNCALTIDYYILTHTRHLRIKILEKNERFVFKFFLRAADKEKDLLVSFKALSQMRDNKKIIKKHYSKKDILNVSSEKYGDTLCFDLSNEKEGSIVDILYTVNTSNLKELPSWSFSNICPTLYSEISTYYPDFFELKRVYEKKDDLNIESSKKKVQYRISFVDRDVMNDKIYSYYELFDKQFKFNIKSNENSLMWDLMKTEVTNINFAIVEKREEKWRYQSK